MSPRRAVPNSRVTDALRALRNMRPDFLSRLPKIEHPLLAGKRIAEEALKEARGKGRESDQRKKRKKRTRT